MTPENTELIQKSIYTLVYTLKNVEVNFVSSYSINISFDKLEEIMLTKTWFMIFLIVEYKLRYSGVHRR